MSVLSSPSNTQPSFEDSNEDLLKLLTDAWDSKQKDTVEASKWTRDYLTKLTSLPLNDLLREPTVLREEREKTKKDSQQLAFKNYPCFLHAQTCRHQVEETLGGLDIHLNEFLSSVPELQEACQTFSEYAKEVKEEREKITRVLDHQNVLTDLLEIPQLMETCVWNGYYSEAMDLASHVRLLQVRYPLSIVKSIHQQVQSSSDLMLVQLISHLRKPIRLAAAMNVVGFLRRMDVFDSETELRMVFLRCRHDFLQQRLTRIKRDISEVPRQRSVDAFEYLKRFIDVMREQMFEIGTQYISIFSSEQGTLLSDYMVHVTGLIKSALDTYLIMIEDTSAVASLLTQLQYCGMSLGRIGLDFRHVFVHSFEEAVQPMILRWIDTATEELVQIISKAVAEGSAPSTWMSSKITSQSSEVSSELKRHTFQPPMLLVGYPSLAIFTNGILSAFNALRLVPAISLYTPIQNHLEACFLEIGVALKQYCHQAASRMPDEMTYLQSYTAAFVRCCLPYLKSCLADGIYGNLLTASVADEDMEALLEAYLPVMEKEDEQVEDNKDEEQQEAEQVESAATEDVIKNQSSANPEMKEMEKLEEMKENDSNKDLEKAEEVNKEEEIEETKEAAKTAEDEQPEKTTEDKELEGNAEAEEVEKAENIEDPQETKEVKKTEEADKSKEVKETDKNDALEEISKEDEGANKEAVLKDRQESERIDKASVTEDVKDDTAELKTENSRNELCEDKNAKQTTESSNDSAESETVKQNEASSGKQPEPVATTQVELEVPDMPEVPDTPEIPVADQSMPKQTEDLEKQSHSESVQQNAQQADQKPDKPTEQEQQESSAATIDADNTNSVVADTPPREPDNEDKSSAGKHNSKTHKNDSEKAITENAPTADTKPQDEPLPKKTVDSSTSKNNKKPSSGKKSRKHKGKKR